MKLHWTASRGVIILCAALVGLSGVLGLVSDTVTEYRRGPTFRTPRRAVTRPIEPSDRVASWVKIVAGSALIAGVIVMMRVPPGES